MSKPRQPNPLNPQVRNEAIEWLLRFSEGEVDAASCEEFNYWLRASPEHVRAYLRIAAFWQEAGRIDGRTAAHDIDALISKARQEANVFPLAFDPHLNERAAGNCSSSAEEPSSEKLSHATRRFPAIAATLLAVIGVVGIQQYLTRDIYETAVGEQRTLNLSDGSTLILNADSRVRVRYSETERLIDLEEGQALFKVAKNPSRPFVVRSGTASVRAVGTQFDVYRKSTGITVTVVEGKVAVTNKDAGVAQDARPEVSYPASPEHTNIAPSASHMPTSVLLAAGEQLIIPKINLANATAATFKLEVRPINIEEATAWTEGLLIFDGAPLTDVIREFNRQNSKPLVLESAPELAQIKITGTFPANGAERITRFLQERFGVVAHETGDHIALRRQ